MTGYAATLTIDLCALTHNYRHLKRAARGAEVAGVVKANAYGLGADRVAPALWREGARTFFVAQLDEGVSLRALLPEARIAILNGVGSDEVRLFRSHALTPVLNQLSEVDLWSAAANDAGKRLTAFIHIDTGMNRLGLDEPELSTLVGHPDRLSRLSICGYLSHLAAADEVEHPLTKTQADRFFNAVSALPKARLSLANSPGTFRQAVDPYDLVRPGSALYGVNPTPEQPNPMQSVIRLEAPILQVRTVPKGRSVGYGAAHAVDRDSRIATLPIGYADGYLRSLSGKGNVRIGAHDAPIVGRVSMDLITVDVTDIPEAALHSQAIATIIGPHRPVDQVAKEAGTIGYEILTGLGARYKRVYLEGPVSSV